MPPRLRLRPVHATFALAVVALFAQATVRSLQATRHILTIVPDDAFYYLDLARHFAQSGTWTFDGGLSRTTGFQPLHAYVCALVSFIWPNAPVHSLLVLHAWIGALVTATGLWFLLRVVERSMGAVGTTGVLVVSTGSNFLAQATNVMEWHWVVLFASLTVFALIEGRVWLAFLAASSGALSRSDFPLLVVAAVAAAALVVFVRSRAAPSTALLRGALSALGGAVAGFCLLTTQNYLIAHELIQSSARVKAFWGTVVGYHLRYGFESAANAGAPGAFLIERAGHSLKLVLAVHAVIALVVVGLWRFFPPPPAPGEADARRSRTAEDERLFLFVVSLLAVTGYAAFYATTSFGIMTWYTANFVVPVALLYSAALRHLRWPYAFPALLVLAGLSAVVGLRNADLPALPHLGYEMDAGLWLREHRPEGRVGGWNVGVLNYFEGGDVVNIDGLTNSAVVPYIVEGRLHCYLLENDIRHVMDWEPMVECHRAKCPPYPAIGGYASGVLARSLKSEYVVPGTENLEGGTLKLTLYSVDKDTLASAGDCASTR
jgi:hypothetical protein